ncbi:MAG: hypothetical protein Q8O89_02735 [Nanoarchaeota archaeon]|nr:hypothetical protein [Nanoarchaeota archaeon]
MNFIYETKMDVKNSPEKTYESAAKAKIMSGELKDLPIEEMLEHNAIFTKKNFTNYVDLGTVIAAGNLKFEDQPGAEKLMIIGQYSKNPSIELVILKEERTGFHPDYESQIRIHRKGTDREVIVGINKDGYNTPPYKNIVSYLRCLFDPELRKLGNKIYKEWANETRKANAKCERIEEAHEAYMKRYR